MQQSLGWTPYSSPIVFSHASCNDLELKHTYDKEIIMSNNKVDPTTKMAPNDINQDGLAKENQQRTDDSALDMMQGMHEHEDHNEEEEK